MKKQTKGGLLGTFVVFTIVVGTPAIAQQPRFEFLAETGIVVIDPGDAGDVVVITGRPLGSRTAGTCGATPDTPYPLQMGVALDPRDSGRRGPRTTEFQPLEGGALRPGTRVVNVALVADCQIGDQLYQKFTGEIE